MKRITIILLTLAVALMAATDASAKGKARRSSSSGPIPSVKTVMKCLYDLSGDCDGSMGVTLPSGVDLLYKENSFSVFGKNVSVTNDKSSVWVNYVATGPHAYYVEVYACSDANTSIRFNSKADRDKFWSNYKKSRYYHRGSKRSTEDGWYCVMF